MEGHTLIYVISILGYLYYISRVIDRFVALAKQRKKIKKPDSNKQDEKEKWMHAVRVLQHDMEHLFKRSMLLIMIIPFLELIVHFIVGNYHLNGQLLTLIFFVLFYLILGTTLLVLKNRGKVKFDHKLNWDEPEVRINSRQE